MHTETKFYVGKNRVCRCLQISSKFRNEVMGKKMFYGLKFEKSLYFGIFLTCYSKKQLVIPNTEIEIQSDKVRHGLMRSVTASRGYKWFWVTEVGRPTVHMSSSMSDCMNRWQRAEFILLPHNWSGMNLHVSVDEVTSLFMVLWTLTNFFWVSLMAAMVAKY